jgi:hypothetical protein
MSHTPTSPRSQMVVVVLPPISSPIELTDILIILTFYRPRSRRNPPLSEGGGASSPKNPVSALGSGSNAVCVSLLAGIRVTMR